MMADEELFREWQEGHAGALEALVRRHHAPLLAHLYRLVGDRAVAEDLVQETFLRLVREAHSYRYPRPFAPWFYTIARNLARNHWRAAAQRHAADGPGDARAADPDADAWLDRLERRDGLRAALAALTLEQREVLSLRFGRDLSVAEAATALGVPAGTVKSRTFAALRLLRARLVAAGGDDEAERRRPIAGEGGHR